MPQIREYRSQTAAKGPIDLRRASADDFGGVGKALVGLGRTAGEFADSQQKRDERSEVSDLAAKLAGVHADTTNDLSETLRTSEPGDKTVSENFMKKYDDRVAKISDSIGTRAGREYYTRNQAEMRAHFLESSFAGQAELAGAKASKDYIDSVNAFSGSLISDPSGFDTVRSLHQQQIDEMVKGGNLSTKHALELKTKSDETLADSAVRGWIRLNPEAAQEQLKSGQWDQFIGGDKKKTLFGETQVAISGRREEAERARKEAERAKEEKQKVTQNGFLKKLTDNSLSADEVLNSNLEAFGSGSKEQFVQLMKARSEQKTKTDPQVFQDVFSRIHLPDGDPKKIVDENELNQYVISGKVTFEDLNHLRDEVQSKHTQAGDIESKMKMGVLESAKIITKSNALTGFRDPVGDQLYQQYQVWFLNEYKKEREAGKSPNDLLDPKSPAYLGKNIRSFIRDNKAVMQDIIRFNVGGVPSGDNPGGGLAGKTPDGAQAPAAPAAAAAPKDPRRDGETAADYLKRIGK